MVAVFLNSVSHSKYSIEKDFYRGNSVDRHVNQTRKSLKMLNKNVSKFYKYLFTPNTVHIKTILTPLNNCDKVTQTNTTNILVFVKSTANEFDLRQSVRATWANSQCFTRYGIKAYIYFTLGRGNSSNWNESLMQYRILLESKQYQDILQFDFVESYYNLTRKLIGTIQYATFHCFTSKFIVLIDHDFIVNPVNLAKFLLNISDAQYPRYVAGHVIKNAKPFRTNKSKWFISKTVFPFNSYPSYPLGGTIIFSRPVISELNKKLIHMKLFPFDDVLLGIVLQKMKIPIFFIKNIFLSKYPLDFRRQFLTAQTNGVPSIMVNTWKSLRFTDMCIP
ncbi:unnamed protein product [Trichobilharzia szidati]|nr:unnamed protein product [Trichobilharzia szidati]